MFCIGDVVFVKMKGFPHWPAKIITIDKKGEKITNFNVLFFGTNESASVRENCVYNYLENKGKYGKQKTENFRNYKFNKALVEAEIFLKSPEVVLSSGIEQVYTDSEIEESDVSQISQHIINLSESLSQMEFEKQNIETSFKIMQEEAEDSLNTLQSKIDSLEKENTLLKTVINRKNNEISTLKGETKTESVSIQCNIEEPSHNNILDFMQLSYKRKCFLLQNKIKELEKNNNTLMDRIDFYPISDENLLNEVKSIENKLIQSEQSHQIIVSSLEKVIETISTDLDNLKTENNCLREENLNLQETIKNNYIQNNFTEVLRTSKSKHISNKAIVTTKSFIDLNPYDCLNSTEMTGCSDSAIDTDYYPMRRNKVINKVQKKPSTKISVKLAGKNNVHQRNTDDRKFQNNKEQASKPILIYGDSMLKFVKINDAKINTISGIDSDKLCEVLEKSEAKQTQPKAIFINVGTNDLDKYRDADDVMGKIYKVIITAKKCFPSSLIVINSILFRQDIYPSLIKKTNAKIRWLCRQYQALFLDTNKYFTKSCLAKDGLHPNKLGISMLNKVMTNAYALYKRKFNREEVSCKHSITCTKQHKCDNGRIGTALEDVSDNQTDMGKQSNNWPELLSQGPTAPQHIPARSPSLDSLEEFPPLPSIITTTVDVHNNKVVKNKPHCNNYLQLQNNVFKNKSISVNADNAIRQDLNNDTNLIINCNQETPQDFSLNSKTLKSIKVS